MDILLFLCYLTPNIGMIFWKKEVCRVQSGEWLGPEVFSSMWQLLLCEFSMAKENKYPKLKPKSSKMHCVGALEFGNQAKCIALGLWNLEVSA